MRVFQHEVNLVLATVLLGHDMDLKEGESRLESLLFLL